LPKLALAYRDLVNGGFENLNHRSHSVSEALAVSEALEETVTPTLASSTSANNKVENLKKVVADER